MKTPSVVTSAASLLAVVVAIASLTGCAVERGTDTEAASTETVTSSGDDGSLGTVEQALAPKEPCEMIPGGCEQGNGQGNGPPEHTNKGTVKLCATQRTACYKTCKGTSAQIVACQSKCTKAHKECLEDY